jgi:drug/metabolite transporter (DMT)-like permease
MSCVQFFVAAFINSIVMIIAERPISLSDIGNNILPLLFLGICSSGIAYTLQIVGQKHAHPAAAAVILSLESVFGVIGSAVFLGERMSTREYVGCVIVFAAVILSQIDVFGIVKTKISGRKNQK